MKEVIILGKGPTRAECPYDKEVWAVNDSYDFAKKIDKLFLSDGWEEFNLKELRAAKEQHGLEIISALPSDNIEVTLFPIEEIMEEFQTDFFSNTICYMLAYAIYMGYERVYFYGIDMLTHTTYITEKGGVEYWMGIANGRNVKVVNTKSSATGKTFNGKIYGSWGDKAPRINEIVRRLNTKTIG